MSTYFKQTFAKYPKDKIVLHHTAGGSDPKVVTDWWQQQNNNIGTCKVIGGISTSGNNENDGIAIDWFDPKYYAYHLGIKEVDYCVSKSSIAIELCNYGQLIKNEKGQFVNYVHGIVPSDQVCELSKPFRNYTYFQEYTEKQLISLRTELLALSYQFNIDLHQGMYKLLKNNGKAFESQSSAIANKPGLWTHVNYRRDKLDCFPQPELIDLILSL